MKLLALDCAASLCAACVYDAATDAVLGRSVLDLGKGHAEKLMGVIESALAQAGTVYGDLGAIGVCVGPGSFTGIRVAVSAARGFALALGVPAIGVDVLEALAREARDAGQSGPVGAVLASGPEGVLMAVYDGAGAVLVAPAAFSPAKAAELAAVHAAVLTGSGAQRLLAAGASAAVLGEAATADIATYARIAASRPPSGKPRPLYIREPDAKPQAGLILPRAPAVP